MNLIDRDFVEEYIQNEVANIDRDIDICGWNRGLQEDLDYINKLTDEDIDDITQKVNDDEELTNKINELIHYWLYHK